jgi:DNA-binding MarR family transcriptional regulator
MFSYSSKPLKGSSEIEENIDFSKLVRLIRNHPNKDIVFESTTLRQEGRDVECRNLKNSKLPWLTPNCIVRKRLLDNEINFYQNFIHSSGFIYYDVDDLSEITSKEEFISNYGHLTSLISKSVTGRGISILVRINRKIETKEDFLLTYDYIKQEYFPSIKFDDSVRRFGSAWILPFDEDVFVNYDSEIEIPKFINEGSCDVYKLPPQHIHGMNPYVESIREGDVELVDLVEGFESHILETKVDFEGVYCIKPTLVLSIRFPERIVDNTKHKVFRKVVHDFVHLNPNASLNSTIRFISHINSDFAKPPMEYSHLKGVVENQYKYIKNTKDYLNLSPKSLRVIHYKKRRLIPSPIRLNFSNQMRGILDKGLTWKRIHYSINYLLDEFGTYTYQDVASTLGISKSTVKRHISKDKSFYENQFDGLIIEIEKNVKYYSEM